MFLILDGNVGTGRVLIVVYLIIKGNFEKPLLYHTDIGIED
jgi:hypothetical protein